MKFAVIGSGGREHAITWKLSQSKKVTEIFVFSNNPGMLELGKKAPVNPNDYHKLAEFLISEKIDYTVIGSEDPLVDGLVDFLEEKGIKAFGPKKAAALLEGSKAFAKEVMVSANVPTAAYKEFTKAETAITYLKQKNFYPAVIKADGLCAGKGVFIAGSFEEGEKFIKESLSGGSFGEAGKKIIIEDFLVGEEVSIFAVTDGKSVKYLSSAQDHKKIYEGDKGPNTGGMGTYAPASIISKDILEFLDQKYIQVVLNELKERNIVYKGVLYAGFILTEDGPKVLEFNCRFGDPETQVILPLLETDFAELVASVCDETLENLDIRLSPKKAVCFVAASGGYPGAYEKGKVIHGIKNVQSQIFFAGVEKKGEEYTTSGGRVLNIVAVENSIEEAREKVLFDIQKIGFEGMQYRKDIAMREVSRAEVAVVMGSDSDLPIVAEGLKILQETGIGFKVYFLSAHRVPEVLIPVVQNWEYQGIKVVIAAAGMAAHLPGVIAGHTNLPVIGIPIESKMNGIDALYSIVQMPGGVPVATVTIGKAGAQNAAILALQILALSDSKKREKLKEYKNRQKLAVLEKNKLLQEIGYQEYLSRKKI
ncbi:MAG TPA: phosphoribosylamine--glycine ligase [Spirochaetia bacterium]|nr:MAG: hypothetical protein A2Y41_10140 [Spirochaetes bacterium GWB1_36_13]HCL55700.1 phosphoribosylamine--glycine ligase [Spirochaetia bacterium]